MAAFNVRDIFGDDSFSAARFPCTDFHIPIEQERYVLDGNLTAFDRWKSAVDKLDGTFSSLAGVTYHGVQEAASRIRKGEIFSSFEEFDFSVDCWAVLNSRSVVRHKTFRDFCIRTCRVGRPMRSRKGAVDSDSCISGFSDDDSRHDKQCREKENQVPNVSQRSYADWCRGKSRGGFRAEGRTPAAAGDITRRSIQTPDLNLNAWIDDSMDGSPLESDGILRKKPKKKSVTGACGQVARYSSAGISKIRKGAPGWCKGNGKGNGGGKGVVKCRWRIRATKCKQTGIISITVCDDKHSCPSHLHRWRGPCQKSLWLAQIMCDRVVLNSNIPVNQLVDDLRNTYERSTNYMQMWRMRERARDWIQGCQQWSFHQIPNLCAMIKHVDPKATVSYDTYPGTEKCAIFKRCFISPSALCNVLENCQKVVALDGCHTKNRKYPCQMLLATVLDGNNQLIVLAYAVCPVENKDNWIWFLSLLRESIVGLENKDVVIISDRQKGLIQAVQHVLPGNIHGHCAQHIRMNIRSAYGKDAETFFIGLVYSTSRQKYDNLLERMAAECKRGKEATEYIKAIDIWRYARCEFPLPRFGKITSNIAECLNSAIKPLRFYAPFRLLCEMWFYLMRTWAFRQSAVLKEEFSMTTYSKQRFDENERRCGGHQVYNSSATTALVRTDGGRYSFIVKQDDPCSCSCFEFQDQMWPCSHSMCLDRNSGADPMRHVNNIWMVKSLEAVYVRSIPPFIVSDLGYTMHCYAPPVAVKKGRHRVVRIPNNGGSGSGGNTNVEELEYSIDDPQLVDGHMPPEPVIVNGAPTRASVRKRRGSGALDSTEPGRRKTVRCGFCHEPGHNQLTCKQKKQALATGSVTGTQVDDLVQPTGLSTTTTSDETPAANLDTIDEEDFNEHFWRVDSSFNVPEWINPPSWIAETLN